MLPKIHGRYRNMIAAMLLFSLLFGMLVPTAYAQDLLAEEPYAENSNEGLPGSETYRSRYTSERWESANDKGILLSNDADGVCLDIQGRGAALSATLLPYDGQTHCNALQIVLENRSACTELVLQVLYGEGTQPIDLTVRLQAHSERTVYYAYLDDVDLIEQLTLTMQGVSDGEVVLYSLSRVSFYEQLPDEKIYGTIQECYYDASAQNVVISGRLRSDSVVDFSGGRIALYRLSMTQDVSVAVKGNLRALQTVKVSSRFTFVVPAVSFEQRNCRYALILISTEGDRVLMGEPCYPSYQTSENNVDMVPPAYKGVSAAQGALASMAQPDAVIVDVYLDDLSAKEAMYTDSFAYENGTYLFDQEYRSLLEEQILPHLQLGRQVYIRISVRANEYGYQLPYTISKPPVDFSPQYLAVRLDTVEAQQAFCAALNYILQPFSSQRTGIAGVILGHSIDNSLQYHYAGMISLQEYLQTVVNVVLHTQNVVRTHVPQMRLYLPVSDTQYPSYYSSYDLDGVYATSMLLDGIARMLEDIGRGTFTFSPLLEMHSVPFDLTKQTWQTEENTEVEPLQYTDRQKQFTPEELVQPLQAYESVDDGCAVIWIPPAACAETPWMFSYIYFYYAMQIPQVNTFFVQLEQKQMSETIATLLSQIDTVYSSQVTRFALPYLDVTSFDTLVKQEKSGQSKQLYTVALTEETRAIYTGRYAYWNFAAAIGTLQWMPSYGCLSLAADGGSRYGRALLAQMSSEQRGGEMIYRFTNPEDFSLCDALALTYTVTDSQGNAVPAKLYLTLYSENERAEGSCVLQSDGMTTVTLSGGALDAAKACTAMSIRLEPLDGEGDQSLNFYLFNIEGLSRIWDDTTLQSKILEQRELRNAVPEEIPEFGVYPILLVTALFVLVLIGAFWSLRASHQRGKYGHN